jgi:hypothetical protein
VASSRLPLRARPPLDFTAASEYVAAVTSPPEQITVRCHGCNTVYKDWRRASINLSLGEDFPDEYIEECGTATCPACGLRVNLGGLIVRSEEPGTEVWEFR